MNSRIEKSFVKIYLILIEISHFVYNAAISSLLCNGFFFKIRMSICLVLISVNFVRNSRSRMWYCLGAFSPCGCGPTQTSYAAFNIRCARRKKNKQQDDEFLYSDAPTLSFSLASSSPSLSHIWFVFNLSCQNEHAFTSNHCMPIQIIKKTIVTIARQHDLFSCHQSGVDGKR